MQQTTKSRVGVKKTPSKNHESLRTLFEDSLKDIYWAEKHLLPALTKLSKECTSGDLRKAFLGHYDETVGQIERLEEVFAQLGRKPAAKKCDAMEGLIEEANGVIEDYEKGVIRDAALIIAAQKVEHYEISAYGSLCALAEVLDMDDASSLLRDTMDEESEADETLTRIAKTVNSEALEMSDVHAPNAEHDGVNR